MDTTLEQRFSHRVPFDEFRVWALRLRPSMVGDVIEAGCVGVLEHVCTELPNNIVDHSGASTAEVAFDWNANSVVLHIEDDGQPQA
jgi:signal transduction histidine kinase